MQLYIIWFIAALILIILEPILPGLVIIWFGFGALFAGLFALLGANFYVQLLVFAIVSLLSLAFIRKTVEKEDKNPKGVGALRLVGKEARVIKHIPAGDYGIVKIDGEEWRAFCETECKEGELVKVFKVEGTHLIVEKKEN